MAVQESSAFISINGRQGMMRQTPYPVQSQFNKGDLTVEVENDEDNCASELQDLKNKNFKNRQLIDSLQHENTQLKALNALGMSKDTSDVVMKIQAESETRLAAAKQVAEEAQQAKVLAEKQAAVAKQKCMELQQAKDLAEQDKNELQIKYQHTTTTTWKLAKEKQENLELSKQLAEQKAQLTQQKKQNELQLDVLTKSQAENEELQRNFEEQKQKLQQSQQESQSLTGVTQRLAEVRAENEALHRQIKELQAEIAQLKQQLEDETLLGSRSLRKMVASLSLPNQEKTGELAVAQQSLIEKTRTVKKLEDNVLFLREQQKQLITIAQNMKSLLLITSSAKTDKVVASSREYEKVYDFFREELRGTVMNGKKKVNTTSFEHIEENKLAEIKSKFTAEMDKIFETMFKKQQNGELKNRWMRDNKVAAAQNSNTITAEVPKVPNEKSAQEKSIEQLEQKMRTLEKHGTTTALQTILVTHLDNIKSLLENLKNSEFFQQYRSEHADFNDLVWFLEQLENGSDNAADASAAAGDTWGSKSKLTDELRVAEAWNALELLIKDETIPEPAKLLLKCKTPQEREQWATITAKANSYVADLVRLGGLDNDTDLQVDDVSGESGSSGSSGKGSDGKKSPTSDTDRFIEAKFHELTPGKQETKLDNPYVLTPYVYFKL